MFNIGSTYLTIGQKPAKVLWIESTLFAQKAGVAYDSRLMTVLHEPYTENERILFHLLDGTYYGAGLDGVNLTEVQYIQEFRNEDL